jgi:excisionase family DNA binding protein
VKLLSIEEVAETLKLSYRTVTRMISDGALPAIVLRSGRRKKVWRIRPEALEKWVGQKERETQRAVKVVSIAANGGTNHVD